MNYIKKLIKPMKNRSMAVIKAKGGPMDYQKIVLGFLCIFISV